MPEAVPRVDSFFTAHMMNYMSERFYGHDPYSENAGFDHDGGESPQDVKGVSDATLSYDVREAPLARRSSPGDQPAMTLLERVQSWSAAPPPDLKQEMMSSDSAGKSVRTLPKPAASGNGFARSASKPAARGSARSLRMAPEQGFAPPNAGGSCSYPPGGMPFAGGSSSYPPGGKPFGGGFCSFQPSGMPAGGGSFTFPPGGMPFGGGSCSFPTGGFPLGGVSGSHPPGQQPRSPSMKPAAPVPWMPPRARVQSPPVRFPPPSVQGRRTSPVPSRIANNVPKAPGLNGFSWPAAPSEVKSDHPGIPGAAPRSAMAAGVAKLGTVPGRVAGPQPWVKNGRTGFVAEAPQLRYGEQPGFSDGLPRFRSLEGAEARRQMDKETAGDMSGRALQREKYTMSTSTHHNFSKEEGEDSSPRNGWAGFFCCVSD